jgi:hypothetical protein
LKLPLRFRIELQRLTMFVNGSHARKKFCVQADGVLVRRQLRRFIGLHFLQRGIRIRGSHRAERGQSPLQKLTGLLHGHQRVLVSRRRWIVGNRLDFGEFLRHARFDCRLIILVLDLVERRRVERQRARRIKWI